MEELLPLKMYLFTLLEWLRRQIQTDLSCLDINGKWHIVTLGVTLGHLNILG